MNLLTKEECEKALDCLSDDDKMDELAQNFSMDDDYVSHANYEIARKWCYDQLKQCIDEHFSNPPLKWEELENGKPIWDNKNKEWLFVNNVLSISSEVKGKDYRKFMKVGYKGRKIYFNVEQGEIDFEPNRFYRKEVQE